MISIESIKQLDRPEKELKTYSCYVELHRNGFIELWTIEWKYFLISRENLIKPSGWNKWSKQHCRRHPNEVSSSRRIRKTTEIGQSESITSDYEFNDG